MRKISAAILAALALAGGAYAWWSSLGFEPGGGGADQLSVRSEPSGDIILPLRLTVWGGGGAIQGRYAKVSLSYRLSGSETAYRLPGQLIRREAKAELYEFRIPRPPASATGPIEYAFEVSLDGQTSTIPGKLLVQAASPGSSPQP